MALVFYPLRICEVNVCLELRLFGAVARLDVYVTTALEEEALLVGMVLWIALCWLDLIASPEDAIGADGVQ